MDARGPLEDEAFALDPSFLVNIRRGNTIVTIDGQPTQIVMGRKGLNKFFDLYYEFLDPATRYHDRILKLTR